MTKIAMPTFTKFTGEEDINCKFYDPPPGEIILGKKFKIDAFLAFFSTPDRRSDKLDM